MRSAASTLAVLQRAKRFEIDQRNQPGVEARDVVGGEQRLDEGAHAASGRADGEPLVAELVQLRQRCRIAVEDPERLVVERHEHDQVAALRRADDAAVHEGDVDAGLRIVQQALVLVCAAGQALFDGHAVAGEDFLVALRVLVVEPVLESGGEHDVARDRALQEPGAQHGHQRSAATGQAQGRIFRRGSWVFVGAHVGIRPLDVGGPAPGDRTARHDVGAEHAGQGGSGGILTLINARQDMARS